MRYEKAEAVRDKAQGDRDCDRAHANTLATEAATDEALKAALEAEKVRLAEIRQDRTPGDGAPLVAAVVAGGLSDASRLA